MLKTHPVKRNSCDRLLFLMSMASCYFPSSQEGNSVQVHFRKLFHVLFFKPSFSVTIQPAWPQSVITQARALTHWSSPNFKSTPRFLCCLPFHGAHPSWPVCSVWHWPLKLSLWQHCRPSQNLTVWAPSTCRLHPSAFIAEICQCSLFGSVIFLLWAKPLLIGLVLLPFPLFPNSESIFPPQRSVWGCKTFRLTDFNVSWPED